MSVAIPMVNDPNLFVDGMYLSWVDGTHINITAGTCRNSTNINDITLAATINWNAAVQGAGGMDIGALANNTVYSIHAIGDSLGYNAGSVIVSTSATAPTLPLGYDMFRRIGSLLTSGAAAILKFTQSGADNVRRFWYDDGIQVLNAGASAAYAAVALAAYMPAQKTVVVLNATLTPTGNGDVARLQPTGATNADGYVTIGGSQAAVAMNVPVSLPCNAAASIDYKVVGTLSLDLRAYDDVLN